MTHPQARHHTEGRVGGWYESELTELGLHQAARIVQRLRELLPADARAELYASDLRRSYQTAEAIARQVQVPIQTTEDLREISYGDAEGRPQSWLDESFVYPPKLGNLRIIAMRIPPRKADGRIADRIYRAMDRILASACPYQIIVTHGFALTFVVAAWIKMPLDAAGHLAVIASSGGITQLVDDDAFANRGIIPLSDTSHLD